MDPTQAKHVASRFNALAMSRSIPHLKAIAQDGYLRIEYAGDFVATGLDPDSAMRLLGRAPRYGSGQAPLLVVREFCVAIFQAYEQGQAEESYVAES